MMATESRSLWCMIDNNGMPGSVRKGTQLRHAYIPRTALMPRILDLVVTRINSYPA
jgi:hypothetical protein